MRTTEQQLTELRVMIAKYLQRQKYGIGDCEARSVELKQMREREQLLLKRYSREQVLKQRGTI